MTNKLYIGDNLDIMNKLDSESIDAIYTDPPYNTNNTKLTYKDNTNDQDWISFMKERLIECHRVMRPTATMLIHIDENMHIELASLINEIFGKKNHIATLIWKKRSSGSAQSKFATVEHEYIIAVAKNKNKCKWNGIPQFDPLDRIEGLKEHNLHNTGAPEHREYPIYVEHGANPNDIKVELNKTGNTLTNYRENQHYPLYYNQTDGYEGWKNKPHFQLHEDENGNTYYNHPLAGTIGSAKSRPKSNDTYPIYYNQTDGYGDHRLEDLKKHKLVGTNTVNSAYAIHTNQTKISLTPFPGSIEILPMNGKDIGCWRCIPSTCQKLINADMLIVKNGKIYQKQYANYQFNKKTEQLEPFVRTTPIRTILQGDKYPTNLRSNKEIKDIYGKTSFTYAKPKQLVKSLLQVVTNKNDIVLDIFAGSGTTGSAAYELGRQFILIQVEEENNIPALTIIRLNKEVGVNNYDVV